jgi:guanylate kinase
MRENEVNGVDYHFVDEETFKQMDKDGKFIENRSYNTKVNDQPATWYYGLTKQVLDKDKSYVTVVDCEGAQTLINYFGKNNCFVSYVFAEDLVRQERAMQRGSFDHTEWTRRLADDAIRFMDVRSIANYVVVNMSNDKDSVDEMIYLLQYSGKVYDAHKKKDNDRYICKLYRSEDGETQCLVTNENHFVKELEGRINRLHEVEKDRC